MEFEFLPAVIAGAVAGVVMSVMMGAAKAKGLTKMDMALFEGALFSGDKNRAKAIGLFMHVVVMSGVFFGSIYALLFAAFDVDTSNAWWYGIAFGVVHAVISGTAMTMMPVVHPRVTREPVPAGMRAETGLQLPAPGPFAKNMGKPTPVGFMIGHILYGLVVGLLYSALV
jgi:uncharacterized membrane protein (UPF0136 family)